MIKISNKKRLSLLRSIEKARDSRVISYISYSPMDDYVLIPLYKQLCSIGKTERIDLFLHSYGGSVDIPYKIVNLIREFCDHFSVIIPFVAKSAATMIAIGADEIIMGPTSELGPIDPLVKHPKYEDMWVPVQSIRLCIEFMEEKIAKSSNPEMTTSLLCPISDKLDPWIIGDYEKSIKASYQYAKTLLEKNMFKNNKEKAKSITRIMTEKYFSHGYCINRKEAKEDLGLNVVQADGALWDIIWALYLAYDDYMQNKDYSFIMEITDDIKSIERK
ncbi:MAG TPA: ATP-dependent Clp protease proteolytic subunit [Methanosarcinales archaeon]|nr:ATP-dependent Clp protease proteolytic subunit [Methanosarcinales archaeon]